MAHRCELCQRDFDSKEALEMHTLAKHTAGSKEEVKEQWKEKQVQSKRMKQAFWYGLVIIAVVLAVYGITSTVQSGGTYSRGQVHWHADLKLMVCGEDIPLPKPTGGSVHGQPFIGSILMHLHNEPQIHVEGTIKKAEDITLGKFMEGIGLNFKETELLEKKNGDVCPDGNSGMVQLLVNGQLNEGLTRHVIVDGEKYEIRFE